MQSRVSALTAVAAVTFITASAAAQQGAVAVQLPTFSLFTVNTTVLAPDSGAGYRAYLERLGLVDPGPLSTPWSSDPGRPPHQPRLAGEIDRASAPRPGSSAARGDESVADIRRRQQTADQENEAAAAAEATAIYERGQRAEKEGKPGVARVYYQMAARRATGALRDEIVARLKKLPSASRTASRKR